MLGRSIRLKVYSKINLSLNISGERNGMHELDMVVASAGFADVITVYERFDKNINVTYSNGFSYRNDSALKAAKIFSDEFLTCGADIFIEKNIPLCAGLGGSSADAAGTLIAFDKIFAPDKKGLKIDAMALKAGSDVPFMLKGGFAHVKMTGESVEGFEIKEPLNLVICKGKKGVNTAEAYKLFDEMYLSKSYCPSDNGLLINALKSGNITLAAKEMKNALQKGSCRLEPEILLTLKALKDTSPEGFLMSGSGSACIGVYTDSNKALIAEKLLRLSGLFATACTTKNSGIEIIG